LKVENTIVVTLWKQILLSSCEIVQLLKPVDTTRAFYSPKNIAYSILESTIQRGCKAAYISNINFAIILVRKDTAYIDRIYLSVSSRDWDRRAMKSPRRERTPFLYSFYLRICEIEDSEIVIYFLTQSVGSIESSIGFFFFQRLLSRRDKIREMYIFQI